MSDELRKLGQRVTALREYFNYSQEELANKCKIDLAAIKAIENGNDAPFWKLCRVAEGLGVNVNRLFSDEALEMPKIHWCNPGEYLGEEL